MALARSYGALIGRDGDVAGIAALLAMSRLVVLTGPGGIGKTSLAAAVFDAATTPDRWFIEASGTREERALALAVATGIGIVVTRDGDAVDAVERYVSGRVALIVIDGAERVAGLGGLLDRWIASVPQLRILVTSRAPLDGRSSVERPVPGLAMPGGDNAKEIARSAAGALFLRRARELGAPVDVDDDNAPALAAVLRRLDGIPLAIELAAGRSRILSPNALLRRLDQPGVLEAPSSAGGDDQHGSDHDSLAAVLAMTVELLSSDERRLLARLTVFEGSFDLELAEAIAAGGGRVVAAMDAIVRSGLAGREPDLVGEHRFRLLETIRAHARLDLAEGDRTEALARLARAVAARTRDAEHRGGMDGDRAMRLLAADDHNVAAAVEWCIDHDASLGLEILDAVQRYLMSGVRLERSVRWHRQLLDRAPKDHARRTACLSTLFRLLMRSAPREAMALAPVIEAAADRAEGRDRRTGHLRLAFAYHAIGDVATAAHHTALAAAASEDVDDALALALDAEGVLAWATAGDVVLAADLLRRSAEAHERAGSVLNAGIGWFKCALLELRADRAAAAVDSARMATLRCRTGNIRAFALDVLAMALAERGSIEEAREATREAWAIVETESLVDRLEALESAVALLAAEGRSAEALSALAAADRERPATGWVRDPHVAVVLERWRIDATRALGALPAVLATAEGRGLTVEAAMAGVVAAPSPRRLTDRSPRTRDGLTAREVEVLALVGEGRSDGEISEALYISRKTASVHVANIKGKLGAASRVEIALHARELGLRPTSRNSHLN